MCENLHMRLWYAVMFTAAATVLGCWYWLTQPLANIGVDVTMSRAAIVAMTFLIFGAIALEETTELVGARRQASRTLHTRRKQAEAGQLSVSAETGSLSLPRGE
jgi:hypothetical protein